VEPQVFDVLALLLRERLRVVPKEELLDKVWGSRFVGDSALTSRVMVLVVGGDVADAGVQPHGVVLLADMVEFDGELTRITDLLQVRPLGLDVAEQRLDPGLVGRGAGPAEALHDRAGGHELFRAV
jgi:hypothetical protein